jgi:hypothetical protein
VRTQKAGTAGDERARSHERVFFPTGGVFAGVTGSGLAAGRPTL